MAEYIECRNCDSPYCDGCNIYSLATMLNNGKFDCLLGNNHSINCSADVVEVVRCSECQHWGGVTYGFVCRKFSGENTKICMHADDFCNYGERRSE